MKGRRYPIPDPRGMASIRIVLTIVFYGLHGKKLLQERTKEGLIERSHEDIEEQQWQQLYSQ